MRLFTVFHKLLGDLSQTKLGVRDRTHAILSYSRWQLQLIFLTYSKNVSSSSCLKISRSGHHLAKVQLYRRQFKFFQRVFDPYAFVMSLRRLKNLEDCLRRRRITIILTARLRDRENSLEWYNGVQFKERFHMFKETA